MKEQAIEIKTREEYLKIFKLLWKRALNINYCDMLDIMSSDNSVLSQYSKAIIKYERCLSLDMEELEGDWYGDDEMYSIKFEQLWNGEFRRDMMNRNFFVKIKYKFKRKYGFYIIPKDVMKVIEEADNDW